MMEKIARKQKTKSVVVVLTHACNLNCTYCYEHFKGQPRMDIESAKRVIATEMLAEDGCDREFELLGGEPLLEFDSVVAIHDFLSGRNWDKKWALSITTNGTLVHGAIKKWIQEHRSTMGVALSVDGTREMHDINRCGSYSLIDFEFFTGIGAPAKMTVSEHTLKSLAEGVIHLHGLGFKDVTANLAFGIDWSREENISTFSRELLKLEKYYLANPSLRPCDLLNLAIDAINPDPSNLRPRYCGAGIEMAAYDVDGVRYPCHTFAPVSVGEKLARISLNLSFPDEVDASELDEKCRNCPVYNVCPNCYGINFSQTGCVYSKDDHYCRMLKVQFLANAHYRYSLYQAGRLGNLTEAQEYRLLRNIALVQRLTT